MTELLRHLTGACMEPHHPSLLTLLVSGVASFRIFSYIKYKLKRHK